MTRLVETVAARIRDHIQSAVGGLTGIRADLRTVFHGPPMEILEPVFRVLSEGGGIDAQLRSGERVQIPVVMQVERLAAGAVNPPIGQSGACEESHLLALRNAPTCPRYVALTPPAQHRGLGIMQAVDEFGLAAHNNAGSASIEDWWNDPFIRALVSTAVDRHQWADPGERGSAFRLVENCVKAADHTDRHSSNRGQAWDVLTRLFSISDPAVPFPVQLALAVGVPPMSDGTLQAEEQIKTLAEIAEALVDGGFRTCVERLKFEADEADRPALDAFEAHVEQVCPTPTSLGAAPAFYYSPTQTGDLGSPPEWWCRLTVERWIELLDEERQPEGALWIECTNSIIPRSRGITAVVVDKAEISIGLPDDVDGPIDATVVRAAGGRAGRATWDVTVDGEAGIVDTAIPRHLTPARYTAEATGLRKANVKIVSLQSWDPGVFVYARTAKKITQPKVVARAREGFQLECSLSLTGQGRHYIDAYVRPGVALGDTVRGYDSRGLADVQGAAPIAKQSDHAFGFEINATAECYFDVPFADGDGEGQTLRLQVTCDDTAAEGARSEFERLVRLHRQEGAARATTDIRVDRRVRCADLQGWILDDANVRRSFYPLVIGEDCASAWAAPAWTTEGNAILSRARFIHDPRPTIAEMEAPEAFLAARTEIASRIRGETGDGLIEAARLGEWLGDTSQADVVDAYVRSYLEWLDSDSDLAAWCDIAVVAGLEPDGTTLSQEPEAILISPMHPLRIGWHSLAQRSLLLAYQANSLCPAASILDPDAVPDAFMLPLRTPGGSIRHHPFFAVDCSSDYWATLWNGNKLDRLLSRRSLAPFDQEFGIQLGGVSSGFSVSQVKRALTDVSMMLAAKPILNVAVSAKSGQTDACNDGLLEWSRKAFGADEKVG